MDTQLGRLSYLALVEPFFEKEKLWIQNLTCVVREILWHIGVP